MIMGRFDEKSKQIELSLKNFVKLNMVKGSDVAYHFIMTKRALKKTKMFLPLKKIVKIYVQLLLLLWFDSHEVKLNTIQDFLCEFETTGYHHIKCIRFCETDVIRLLWF